MGCNPHRGQLAAGLLIRWRRERRGRGERAVALKQIFQFCHVATEVPEIAPRVIETFPYFGEMISEALFHQVCSFTREVGIPDERAPPRSSLRSRGKFRLPSERCQEPQ